MLIMYVSFYVLDFPEPENMAEAPHPASQSSQSKSSCQKEEELAIIEPDVTCGHCKKELNNPYLLCCLHSVCAECLPNMVVENVRLKCSQCGDTSTAWNDGKMSESECRVDSVRCFPVPNGPLARYIEGMKIVHKVTSIVPILCGNRRCRNSDSPSTVYCIDCAKFLCERCCLGHEVSESYEDHTVKTLEEIGSPGFQGLPQSSKYMGAVTCQWHKGKVLDYICEHCDLLMCQACAIDLKPPHSPKHISSSQFDIVNCNIRLVKTAYQVAVHFEKKCERMENDLQSKLTNLERAKEVTRLHIDKAFQNIYQAVEKRKEDLCRQVVTTVEEKKDMIVSQLTDVQQEKEKSRNTQSSLQFLLSNGSSHDVIASKDVIRRHQSVLTSKWCQEELESTVSQVVTFDPTNQDFLLKAIHEFGVVESGACPANCTVETKPESVQWKDSDPVTLTVTTFDRENIRCKRGGDNVEAFLHPKSPIPGLAIKARVVDDKNGRYTISFPTTYPGECDLYIRVNGRDIRGSQFVVNYLPIYKSVVNFLPKSGSPKSGSPKSGLPKLNKNVRELGANKGYLNYPQQGGVPWDIAVGQNGVIFVGDHYKHQIHIIDKQRKYIRSFGQRGSGNGQLYNPTGIAVDHDNRLYIGNYSNKRIEVVENDGTFVRQIGAGYLSGPSGVTVHNKHVFVAEYGNHRISVFTLDSQLIRTIGSYGSGPGQFIGPCAVAFASDEDGDMYVLDRNNSRIQVFNANGVYQREFGKGQLSNPLDIICTTDHHVLVADNGNSRVVIFNTMGQLIHSFQVGSYPRGLAIDHNGDLLVTLFSTNQVAVF